MKVKIMQRQFALRLDLIPYYPNQENNTNLKRMRVFWKIMANTKDCCQHKDYCQR